jgi:hypothetical protein
MILMKIEWVLKLCWWVSGRGFVVGLDVFKDFDFGDVGELMGCGGAIAALDGWGVGAACPQDN